MMLAISGGVGGAKLAAGLAQVLAPEDLTIAVNTGDDFVHLGLAISPDLDTVMYTLAGLNDTQRGWGLANETWSCMDSLRRLGAADWFQLGGRDLGTHLYRSHRLSQGATLTEVTAELCRAVGIRHAVVPMSDAPARTIIDTSEGELSFQDYFVRRHCEPAFRGIRFEGGAALGDRLDSVLRDGALKAIIFGPSNPILSIRPFLALPGFEAALRGRSVPAVAVSPIIGNAAVKGPLAKIMTEMGTPVSALEVARLYVGLIDAFVIDVVDAPQAPAIRDLGLDVIVTPALMVDAATRNALARTVIEYCSADRKAVRT